MEKVNQSKTGRGIFDNYFFPLVCAKKVMKNLFNFSIIEISKPVNNNMTRTRCMFDSLIIMMSHVNINNQQVELYTKLKTHQTKRVGTSNQKSLFVSLHSVF